MCIVYRPSSFECFNTSFLCVHEGFREECYVTLLIDLNYFVFQKSYHNDNFLSSENGTVNGLKQEENGNGEKADNNMNDIVVTQL